VGEGEGHSIIARYGDLCASDVRSEFPDRFEPLMASRAIALAHERGALSSPIKERRRERERERIQRGALYTCT